MVGISIIIPCFKRVEQTKKTLTLLYQSNGWNTAFHPEIIIADSSMDETIKDMASTFTNPKPIYVKPDHPGVATNKNAGAKIATHPILIFCDSDMEVESDTVSNTIKSLQNNPTSAAITGQIIWKGGPQAGKLDRPREEDKTITIGNTVYIEAIYSRYMATYRAIFQNVGGYDEEVFNMRGEGSDLSIRYWRYGYPLSYDSTISAHHVYDAPDSIALRIVKPELAIAKDLLLLAYKYGTSDKDQNFRKTVAANFRKFGDEGYGKIIEGIQFHLDLITTSKSSLDHYKTQSKAAYPFTFLEIFSYRDLFDACIKNAQTLLSSVRDKTFI